MIVPLILADITRGTGRFNLAQGIVGTGAGIGAALSTTAAGYLADAFGVGAAFLGLAALAACGPDPLLVGNGGNAAGAGGDANIDGARWTD